MVGWSEYVPLVSNWMLTGIGMGSFGKMALICEWTLGKAGVKCFGDMFLGSLWNLAGILGRHFGHMALTQIGVGFLEDNGL